MRVEVSFFFMFYFCDFVVFYNSGFKRTLCGSKWESLTDNKNAFYNLGSQAAKSTARYGCCPKGQFMSSPFLITDGGFDAENSCDACPIGQYGSDGDNDDTSCTTCEVGKNSEAGSAGISSCKNTCPPTPVTNSNHAEANPIIGDVGTRVIVTCNPGWSGTKATVCGANLQWSLVVECTINNCTATQVLNSDKSAADSITGM